MAIPNLIASGIGFTAESGRWIVTQGLSFPSLLTGPDSVRGVQSHLIRSGAAESDLSVASTSTHSRLNLDSSGDHSDLK